MCTDFDPFVFLSYSPAYMQLAGLGIEVDRCDADEEGDMHSLGVCAAGGGFSCYSTDC